MTRSPKPTACPTDAVGSSAIGWGSRCLSRCNVSLAACRRRSLPVARLRHRTSRLRSRLDRRSHRSPADPGRRCQRAQRLPPQPALVRQLDRAQSQLTSRAATSRANKAEAAQPSGSVFAAGDRPGRDFTAFCCSSRRSRSSTSQKRSDSALTKTPTHELRTYPASVKVSRVTTISVVSSSASTVAVRGRDEKTAASPKTSPDPSFHTSNSLSPSSSLLTAHRPSTMMNAAVPSSPSRTIIEP